MRNLTIAALILFTGCEKAADIQSATYCWKCHTDASVIYNGIITNSVQDATYCNYTEYQIAAIEQAGTYNRTTTTSGVTYKEIATTHCIKQ